MDKIWIVVTSYRLPLNNRSYNKKYKIYKTEAELVKNISNTSSSTILEYELKSSTTASDYFKSKERNTQLRSILGELSDHELNAQNLIKIYEELGKEYNKIIIMNQLKKISDDKKSFSSYLVKNKGYFFQVSDSLEWILSILKCHNFREHIYNRKRWNSSTRSYDIVDNSSDLLRRNFKLAKLELKKKK